MLQEDYGSPALIALVLLHIMAGFVAVFGGLAPLLTPKGGTHHVRYGYLAIGGLLVASVTAFPLAIALRHDFQFAIGTYGLLATLSGLATVRKSWRPARLPLAILSVLAGTALPAVAIASPQTFGPQANIVVVAYGVFLTLASAYQLANLQKPPTHTSQIIAHLSLLTVSLLLAWASYVNTQLHRLTGLEWSQTDRMLLPALVAALPFAIVVYRWKTGSALPAARYQVDDLRHFHKISLYEGISYLLLMGVAMPARRLFDLEILIRVFGPIHGTLTMVYAFALWFVVRRHRLKPLKSLILLALAVVPFGWLIANRLLPSSDQSSNQAHSPA